MIVHYNSNTINFFKIIKCVNLKTLYAIHILVEPLPYPNILLNKEIKLFCRFNLIF